MAQIIVQPQCSVSPAGGGTITYTPTTSGQFTDYQSSRFQNYKYTATPARGYRFKQFNTDVILKYKFHYPDNPSADSSGQFTSGGTYYSNPHESDLSPSGTIVDSRGGAYWYAEDYGWEQYEYWISSIQVVAYFERIPDGPMLLFDDSTGRLIFDDGPYNSGRLVYGGTLP